MSIHDPVFDDSLTVALPPPSHRDWENAVKWTVFPILSYFHHIRREMIPNEPNVLSQKVFYPVCPFIVNI